MNKMAKKLLSGVSAAAAGAAAVGAAAYASTRYLVGIAMDRKLPFVPNYEKARQQLRGNETAQDFLAALESGAQALLSLPHETVRLTADDGQTLVGHWYPCPQAQRVIVAMHGWRSAWNSDFGMIAPFWQKNRCSVLFAEQRGQGSSGGEYMGFGMTERYDCLCWVRWVNETLGRSLPVYLAGVSMGATTVLMAAQLPLPENVAGILADCGFTSAHAIWKHVAQKNLHLHYPLHEAMADRLCRQRIDMDSKACATTDAMAVCPVPVLFAHGSDDSFVPVEMTYENYKACAAPKQMLIVPGADHGMSYYTEKEKYENTILEFWKCCEERGPWKTEKTR